MLDPCIVFLGRPLNRSPSFTEVIKKTTTTTKQKFIICENIVHIEKMEIN